MKKDFTQIANGLAKDAKIPDGAFRTYVVLKSFKYGTGNVFPSQETLAKLRGKSKKTIITHLKLLRERGLIKYKRRGYSASNQYEFIGEENYTNDSKDRGIGDTSNVKGASSLLKQKLHPNNTKINNTEIKNIDYEVFEEGMERIIKKNPWLKAKKR